MKSFLIALSLLSLCSLFAADAMATGRSFE
jgi:hypothetical protein